MKGHPFFTGIEWVAIQQRRVTPPFKPNISEGADVKYFDKEFVDLPAAASFLPRFAILGPFCLVFLEVVNSEVADGAHLRDVNHFEGFTYQGSDLDDR